jgi:hypothetical protein
MAQGTTTYPTAVDAERTNPSNMDSSEAAMIAVQTKLGIGRVASADGAIAVAAGEVVITKSGSAAALTLAAPTAAMDYQRLVISSATAFAHVVTATDLLEDGITGGAKDTATFGAFAGASLELMAYNLKWLVLNKNVVTIAAV